MDFGKLSNFKLCITIVNDTAQMYCTQSFPMFTLRSDKFLASPVVCVLEHTAAAANFACGRVLSRVFFSSSLLFSSNRKGY